MAEITVYDAKAGGGKTTALIEKLKKLKGKTLFLTFNKSLQLEFQHLQQDYDVEVSTFHSLAYRWTMQNHGDFQSWGEYQNFLIKRWVGVDTKEASILMTLINHFCYSTLNVQQFVDDIRNRQEYYELMTLTPKVIQNFKRLIAYVLDKKDFTHDFYLKLYQLKGSLPDGYDNLIVDEYQDFSQAMRDVIEKSIHKFKTVTAAEDEDQRIYEWRGASPQKEIFSDEYSVVDLHNTWRCPQEIIDVVNPYLSFLSDTTMGTNVKHSGEVIQIPDDLDMSYVEFPQEDLTCISRTNPILYVMAERFVNDGWNVKINCGTNITGVEQHFRWLNNEVSGNKFLDKFRGDAKELAQVYESSLQKGKLSQLGCASAIESIDNIKRGLMVFDPDSPTAILTNAFVSKGLEYDNVAILPTYETPFITDNNYFSDSDLRYLYVAITRAKKKLYIHEKYCVDEVHENGKTYVKSEDNDDFMSKFIRLQMAVKSNRRKDELDEDEFDYMGLSADEIKMGKESLNKFDINVKSVTHISKNDPGLAAAIGLDKANAKKGLYSVETGHANRYIESKMTGIHQADLKTLEEADILLPSEEIMAKLMMM